MAETNTVVVYDLESLKNYYERLSILKEEIRNGGQRLHSLADKLSNKANTMASITSAQGGNWQDPQYDNLSDAIAPCVTALKLNAESMEETNDTIEATISQIDASLAYLRVQIDKISGI